MGVANNAKSQLQLHRISYLQNKLHRTDSKFSISPRMAGIPPLQFGGDAHHVHTYCKVQYSTLSPDERTKTRTVQHMKKMQTSKHTYHYRNCLPNGIPRPEPTQEATYSTSCTHMLCRVQDAIPCPVMPPCHAARFNYTCRLTPNGPNAMPIK
jgi:hypothetical protein